MTTDDPSPDQIRAIGDWLIAGGTGNAAPQDVLRLLCERMLTVGLPIARATVFVTTPHPQVVGRRFLWRAGEETTVTEFPHGYAESPAFQATAVPLVTRTQRALRWRLEAGVPPEFPLAAELRAIGITDHLIQPLIFSNGDTHAVGWSTARPGGFSEADIRGLEMLVPSLTRIAEIYALRRTARSILDAYLGKLSGERVLKGAVKRGDSERLNAVIWFSDLRNSTPLAEAHSPEDFLHLLNDYFECLAGAVLSAQGEVLRFIGDAVLAIFPTTTGGVEAACRAALAAAQDGIGRMAALNARRRDRGEVDLGFGIGLHVGDVLYGNIGVPERVEFTVIGHAANQAARIESLCKELGVPLVLSADFVRALPGTWRSLGHHALRGVSEPQEVFTLP